MQPLRRISLWRGVRSCFGRGPGLVVVAAVALVALAAAPCPTAFGQTLSDPGPFRAGWRQVTVARANSTTFTARLYYPATTTGQDVPLDGAGAPYPAISFGHGFFQSVSSYQSTLLHLATHGYIVIATDSEGGLSPSHANFASDISRSLTYLEQSNVTGGSLLFGAVDSSHFGVAGHSMGGGAAILAAASDARIRMVVGLAAAETTPSANAAIATLTVPVRLIAGSSDTIVSATATTQPMYNAARAPKQFPLLQGGFHCGYQDSSFPIGCDTGTLARADQLALTRRLITEWANLYLKADATVAPAVWGAGATDPRVTLTRAAGVELTPLSAEINAERGRDTGWTLSVRNTAPFPQAFAIEVTGPWPAGATPPSTPPIAPLSTAEVTVTLSIPHGTSATSGVFGFSARSLTDGGTRAYASLRVDAFCPADLGQQGGVFGQDGQLDNNDFIAFINYFFDASPVADLGSQGGVAGSDGQFDNNDFIVFIDYFFGPTGCP